MPQVITLEGLPEPVAKALIETVNNLKNSYRMESAAGQIPPQMTAAEKLLSLQEFISKLPLMPALPDEALSRESMYAPENDEG